MIRIAPGLIHLSRGMGLRWPWVWVAVCGGVVVFGLLFRQPFYPTPWFDEGLNSSAAASLATDGVYGLPDSAGARVLDPAIQTGPTVIVPIALVYWIFGLDIEYARLAILPFVVLALVAYAALARRLLGEWAMVLAVVLLLVGNGEPFASFIFVGRQVLGEVPALAYLLLGILIWIPTLEQRAKQWPRWILSGLAWGIAMVTKSQVLLLLPVALVVLALVNDRYYRVSDWWAFIVPGCIGLGCIAAWYGTQIWIAGPAQFQRNAAILHEGFGLHIVDVNPANWSNALHVIWHSGWWWWGPPGLVWGLWQARQRTVQGFIHALALALPLVALVWFSLFSIGWGRYAFYIFVLTPIWTAGLLHSLWHHSPKQARWHRRQLLVSICIGAYIIGNGWPTFSQMLQPNETGYLELQEYLTTHVRPTARIETWEWELSLGITQPIHHPPTQVANSVTAAIWHRTRIPDPSYDPLMYRPDYLIQGPFSSWTGIYHEVIGQHTELVGSFGNYTLYQFRPELALTHGLAGPH